MRTLQALVLGALVGLACASAPRLRVALAQAAQAVPPVPSYAGALPPWVSGPPVADPLAPANDLWGKVCPATYGAHSGEALAPVSLPRGQAPNPVPDYCASHRAWRDALGTLPASLAEAQQARCDQLRQRTLALVERGFTYGVKTLSLTPFARSIYTGLATAAAQGALTYDPPIQVGAMADTDGGIALTSSADVAALFKAASDAFRAAMDSEIPCKVQVLSSLSVDDVVAVADPR